MDKLSKHQNKMLFGSIFAVLLGFTVGTLDTVFADTPELLSDVPVSEIIPNTSPPSIPSDNLIIESKQVYVDTSVFEADQISITTFDETLIITKDILLEKDGYNIWYGTDEDGFSTNFIIEGDTMHGSIQTANSNYKIAYGGTGDIHTLKDLDLSQLPPEHASQDEIELADFFNLPQTTQDDITLFADSHIGDHDYSENTVTITLVVGYTTEVDDEFVGNIEDEIEDAVNNANRSYRNNGIPIELDLVDNDEVRGYTEEISDTSGSNPVSGLSKDLVNLRDSDMDDLDGLRGQGLRDDADIIISNSLSRFHAGRYSP